VATNNNSPKQSSRKATGSKVVRSAVGAVVGGAALGVANRLADRYSRPKVLGIRIPNELNPQRLNAGKVSAHVDVKRLAKNVDLKDLIRQIGNLAEQVEAHSEDVRSLSGQAKRLSRRIS
jgi:ribosomal protein S15P/S13E